MWVQRLQRSKFVPIALIVLLLVFSFQASRPQAVGLDTAVKIVAGSNAQKVVRAIGEKAGMAFTPKSLQATTDYINGQAAKGNVKYIDLAKKANAATGVPDSTKPGWKKYLLDPVMWLTGADLLVEAYDAFNDAQQGGYPVDMYGEHPTMGGYCYAEKNIYPGQIQFEIMHPDSTSTYGAGRYYTTENPTCEVVDAYASGSDKIQILVEVKANGVYKGRYSHTVIADPVKWGGDLEYSRNTSDDDEYDISNVTNADTYRNTINNEFDYSKVTYDNDIEIYAPDETNTTDTDNYVTPWNPKMSDDEFNQIISQDVTVVVPPSDGDDLPTGERPDPVEVLDRSVLDVMVKSYEFFDDAIDATVVSMKSVVDGAGGIVTFLDESMDWLPSEWRAVFVSTFLLGVFAHFFRR